MFRNIKPRDLIGITGLLLFVISFFIPFRLVDIHLLDTYYVFEMGNVYRNAGGALSSVFVVCTFLRHQLNSVTLNWLHSIASTLSVAFVIYFLYIASEAYRPGFSNWTTYELNNNFIVIGIVIFAMAQLLLVASVIIGLIKKQKEPPERNG